MSAGKDYVIDCQLCNANSPIPLSQLRRTFPLRTKDQETNRHPDHHEEETVQTSDSESNDEQNSKISTDKQPELDSTTGKDQIIKPIASFLHRFAKTTIYRNNFLNPKSSRNRAVAAVTSKLSNYPEFILEASGSGPSRSRTNSTSLSSSLDKTYQSSSRPGLTTANAFYQTLSRYSNAIHFKDSATQTSLSRCFLKRKISNSSTGSKTKLIRTRNVVLCRHVQNSNKCCSLPTFLLASGYIIVIILAVTLGVVLTQRERRPQGQLSALPIRPTGFPGAIQAPTQGRANIRRQPIPKRTRILTTSRAGTRGRRVRPSLRNQQEPVQQVVAVAPRPVPVTLAPRPVVVPVPKPAQQPTPSTSVFKEENFDYFPDFGFDNNFYDNSFILPNEIPEIIQPTTFPPRRLPARFPPPSFATQSPAPAQEVRTISRASHQPQQVINQQQPTPRRGLSNNFQQGFNLNQHQTSQQQQQDLPRGQKQPAVQIVKSWNTRNTDGTYSWGYINTDGSFKNETKGADCVVRGVYGYVDTDTGETLTFPYATGNPCNPDQPDYFYDYDAGTLNVGGKVVQRVNAAKANRRNIQ